MQLTKPYEPIVAALTHAFGGRLRTVVLFGSQARGDARPDSDHDILIVVDQLPTSPLKRQHDVRSVLLPILNALPGDINFVAKTPEEVDANLTPLLLDVCTDGICLFGDAYFEPYRRRALAAIEQAGLRRERLAETLMWRFPSVPKHSWELTWDGFSERA